MRKFKLIKKYLNSPELGTIVDKNSPHNIYTQCVDYPEFWEEVVEKDYEILSYIQNISNRIYFKDKEGFFVSDNGWSLSEPVESHSNISIHSVKRLSDSQVFTVGDRVYLPKSNDNYTIKNFTINTQNTLMVSLIGLFYNADLTYIEKFKQPLFRTEDGVDIFEGDKVYYCNKDYKLYNSKADTKFHNGENKNYKYFSTKETAEKYILENKPCLSIKDVLKLDEEINNGKTFSNYISRGMLYKLVKNKING